MGDTYIIVIVWGTPHQRYLKMGFLRKFGQNSVLVNGYRTYTSGGH